MRISVDAVWGYTKIFSIHKSANKDSTLYLLHWNLQIERRIFKKTATAVKVTLRKKIYIIC